MPSTDKTQPLTGPEIVEQVRRAIYADASAHARSEYSNAHRATLAVLDAIREPSAAMLKAAGLGDYVYARSCIHAYIDALRKEIAG